MYVVAKAVHEMQRELKVHPDIFFSNLEDAPDKVGGKNESSLWAYRFNLCSD